MDENDRQQGVTGGNEEYMTDSAAIDSSGTTTTETQTNDAEAGTESFAIEEVIIDAEIEPETISTPTPDQQESPSLSSETVSPMPEATEPSEKEAEKPTTPPIAAVPQLPAMGLSTKKENDKKRLALMVAAAMVLLVLIGAVIWWLVNSKKDTAIENRTDDVSSTPIEQPKLGLAITVADGSVGYMRDGLDWQPADMSTELKEGDSVRTEAGSRAVLTLDDGSAVRLDAETTLKIVSLATDDVKIDQTSGIVYSRVVPSNRTYTVAIDDTTYEALGTAFTTINKLGESGVQVYQSAVKVSGATETVSEGSQYFTVSSDAERMRKVTTIDIDSLVANDFINWNAAEDEKDASFKEKLGILPQIKQRAEEKKKQNEEAARQQAEKEAAENAVNEDRMNMSTREEMTLSYKNGTFSWNFTGNSPDGYKLVYSTTDKEPAFDGKDTKSIYFSGKNEMSGTLPGKGTFHVRICAYSAATGTCSNYSNTVHVSIN